MARRGQSRPRNIKEDLIYKNKLVARLINRSMKDGKKSVAEKEVYRAFELIKEDLKDDPIKVFPKHWIIFAPQWKSGQGGWAVLHIRFRSA